MPQDGDADNGIIVCHTQEELNAALERQCQKQWKEGADKPTVTIEVDMVMIEDTELYSDVKELVSVSQGHCTLPKWRSLTSLLMPESLSWSGIV